MQCSFIILIIFVFFVTCVSVVLFPPGLMKVLLLEVNDPNSLQCVSQLGLHLALRLIRQVINVEDVLPPRRVLLQGNPSEGELTIVYDFRVLLTLSEMLFVLLQRVLDPLLFHLEHLPEGGWSIVWLELIRNVADPLVVLIVLGFLRRDGAHLLHEFKDFFSLAHDVVSHYFLLHLVEDIAKISVNPVDDESHCVLLVRWHLL